MFWHNFKYAVKTMFRNRMMIFWTFAFPIILGTFFNMAFSNIESSEKLDIIDIAVVDNAKFRENEVYKQVFANLGDESVEDRLFDISYVEEDEAERMLANDEIAGYLVLKDEPSVVVNSNGVDETILKYVVEEIGEYESIFSTVMASAGSRLPAGVSDIDGFYRNLYLEVKEKIEGAEANIADASNENMSYTMIEFYTLIAMTCLYGGTLGMYAINQCLANMSNKGKRVAVSPTAKRSLILSSVLASYVVQLAGVVLLFAYTILVLGVDYGTKFSLIALLAAVGSLAGLSMGVAVAALFKAKEDTKTGIIISVTMFGCFLAGMMGITMKYIVDVNVPFVNMINPANMITDGFYALYYYSTNTRFYFDLFSLLAFSSVMIGAASFSLRRQRYDSI